MELTGRLALVTGAGQRLGRAMAAAIAEHGMDVAVHHHASEAGALSLVREIQDLGRRAEVFRADLTRHGAATALVREVVGRMGPLDVLVNSAAVMRRTPWDTVTEGEWDAMFALNLRGAFFVAREAALAMGERGGVIVNIADLAAFETWPAYIPHGITKGGVVQMTRALARVLAPAVRVNAIAPGTVLLPESSSEDEARHLSDTTPLRRLGSPADVVGALLYLLSADYVTGETIIVDGGRHVRK